MNLSERIEKRKNRMFNKDRIITLFLLFTTVAFGASNYIYKERLEVLKNRVIYYDYDRGSKELKEIARNI
ncbi:hypothetical protein [Fusobacterium sp.]|uniref:hypothetical protein n=1 Tax=Fusobacterium sp. TaxID=68766 RepID=UPI0026050683|nr:hypothetical protein [Fusobacterium sp.]